MPPKGRGFIHLQSGSKFPLQRRVDLISALLLSSEIVAQCFAPFMLRERYVFLTAEGEFKQYLF